MKMYTTALAFGAVELAPSNSPAQPVGSVPPTAAQPLSESPPGAALHQHGSRWRVQQHRPPAWAHHQCHLIQWSMKQEPVSSAFLPQNCSLLVAYFRFKDLGTWRQLVYNCLLQSPVFSGKLLPAAVGIWSSQRLMTGLELQFEIYKGRCKEAKDRECQSMAELSRLPQWETTWLWLQICSTVDCYAVTPLRVRRGLETKSYTEDYQRFCYIFQEYMIKREALAPK